MYSKYILSLSLFVICVCTCANVWQALDELLQDDERFGFIVMDGNGTLYGTLQGRSVSHSFVAFCHVRSTVIVENAPPPTHTHSMEAGGGAQGTQGLSKNCTRRYSVPFVASFQRFLQ